MAQSGGLVRRELSRANEVVRKGTRDVELLSVRALNENLRRRLQPQLAKNRKILLLEK